MSDVNAALVYPRITAERERQEQIHPGKTAASLMVTPTGKLAILVEEVGEVARDLCDGDLAHIETELIQVAAVAIAWLESIAYQRTLNDWRNPGPDAGKLRHIEPTS